MTSKCPVCERVDSKVDGIGPLSQHYQVHCEVCGEYTVSEDAKSALEDRADKVKISSYLVHRQLKKLPPITITVDDVSVSHGPSVTIAQILREFPRNLHDRMDKALINLGLASPYTGFKIHLDHKDYPLLFPDSRETNASFFVLENLLASGLIVGPTGAGFPSDLKVSSIGWGRIYELQQEVNKDSLQGFAAMWFDPSMNSPWENAFFKAIKDAGFEPKRIDQHETNNKICDEIIVEIKKSKFLVADFTGQRGGVYFEAGYALGMGITVIWTCREDWFNNEIIETKAGMALDGKMTEVQIKEFRNTHFDINHYSFIVWKDEEDLYKRLYNRIVATIQK